MEILIACLNYWECDYTNSISCNLTSQVECEFLFQIYPSNSKLHIFSQHDLRITFPIILFVEVI